MFVFKYQLATEFGLTPKMIEKLGEPDKYGPNPHNPRGHSHLYLIARVSKFSSEHADEIKKAKERRDRIRAKKTG